MTRILLVAVLTLLAFPVAAGAWSAPNPILTGERAALAYAQARGWHNHCSGGIVWFEVLSAEESQGGTEDIWAYADLNSCTAYIEVGLDPATKCDAAMHEGLHLIRGDTHHDLDPRSPLYPVIMPQAACRAATIPVRRMMRRRAMSWRHADGFASRDWHETRRGR